MMTWREGDVVHRVTHINEEKRAGRLGCGRYVEPWPKDIADEPVTCLMCAVVIDEDILRAERDEHVDRDIAERGDEVSARCGEQHREQVDANDRCVRCGYGQIWR